MPTALEAIAATLASKRQAHNGPDLLDRWTPGMETQVNVAAGAGKPVEDRRHTWTDGTFTWWHVRIPKQADSEPYWNDYQIGFPISEYAEAIGCTGWDWQGRCSRWVGFDFDSITGHAKGVGITDAQLDAVLQAAIKVPYAEIRKSTGGSGIHIYVLLDEIPTANHTEHAALGRAVLGMLSSEVNFNFASAVDACGGNMWIWHRKMTPENGGLSLIKEAEHQLNVHDLPSNWRDHVEVVTRKRSKIKLQRVNKEETFEQLTSSRTLVPLDARHKAVIKAMEQSGYLTDWVSDYHLLQTHTCAFKELSTDYNARAELGLVGFFDTLSDGDNPGEPNCFAFPTPDGGWKVYRFSEGIREADSWEQDGSGWTWCTFNRVPDLEIAARAYGGGTRSEGGFQFDRAADAIRAAAAVGQQIELPSTMLERQAILKTNKDGRLVLQIKSQEGDPKPGTGWVSKRGGWWERVFNLRPTAQTDDPVDVDQFIRVLMTSSGEPAGTYVVTDDGQLHAHAGGAVTDFLQSHGFDKTEASKIKGQAIRKPYTAVHLPFQPEFLPNRLWNRGVPQFRIAPSTDRDNVSHPHWDLIFNHCGQSLTTKIHTLDWAKRAGIVTGGDYLRAIFASIIQKPFAPTPYIGLYGPEGCGKSILWEAPAKLLFTGGVAQADLALTNASGFNGELEGALICVVEEVNVASTPCALARMKYFTTALTLNIRRMRCDCYPVPNMGHWFQFTNFPEFIPTLPGDTRQTICYVPPLPAGQRIAKHKLLGLLEQEAPAVLRTLLDFQLPEPTDRLSIPIVETADKTDLQTDVSPIVAFVNECCDLDGHSKVARRTVFDRYIKWCQVNDVSSDGFTEFGRKLQRLYGSHILPSGKADYTPQGSAESKSMDAYRGVRLKAA